jgi:hypothetical protein
MRTQLQKELAKIAPSVSIETIWEVDPDCEREFKQLSRNPGDCFYGEDRATWQPWQSEIRATAIVGGEELTGSAYLGATWEKYGDNPAVSNPEISGYEPQMTVEALEELIEAVAKNDTGEDLMDSITHAITHVKAKMRAAYEAQQRPPATV